MLLSFRFANHRSFRDEQQLNLTPVYTDDDASSEGPLEAVPVVGIFGANASGKSNVISALDYVRTMVGTSDRESEPGLGPRRDPFRLDPGMASQPSSYAADLLLDGVRYTYGFTLDTRQITEEWLYSYPFTRKRVVFERTNQIFDWGEESGRSTIRRLEEIVSPSALFLSVAARFDSRRTAAGERDSTSSTLHAAYSWLWQKVSRIGPQADGHLSITGEYARALAIPDKRAAIINLLRAADVGLEDVIMQDREDQEHPDELADESDDSVDGVLENFRRIVAARLALDNGRRMHFLHRGATGSVTLDLADESSGTVRLLELAVRAVSVLEAGGLFLIDEIDASLHPLLTAALIRLFQSPAANDRNAQLLFTTHDATLLDSIDGEDILHRDQVWFTSKGDDGASELFSLAEFKPRRQGENRQKRYLNGSYGAIPEISMRLFEQAVASRTDSSAS